MKASNGYAFAPENISQALELCELETLLSMNERPGISYQNWEKPIGSERVIKGMPSRLGRSAKFEQVGFGVAPASREPRELSSQSMNVGRAIETHSSQDTSAGADSGGLGVGGGESSVKDLGSVEGMTSAGRQRLMQELRASLPCQESASGDGHIPQRK